jgi:hypothetical protein
MGVTLDQLLMLAGRLDDAPGFDTPRERYRRFLLDYVGTAQIARSLIEQCQHAPGEQHRRALEDLVVLLGRFIGFHVTFGTHLPVDTGLSSHGHWRSHSHMHVVLDVRSAQTAGTDPDRLLRVVAALAGTPLAAGSEPVGLSVRTPLHMGLDPPDEAGAASRPAFPISAVSLGALLSLAEMVSMGPLTHEDVVRILKSNTPLDFVVGLLEKCSDGRRVEPSQGDPAPPAAVPEEQSHWIVAVAPDHGITPETLLELVVGKRHVLGITGDDTAGSMARGGDRICFYISGKGVVGHARVVSGADPASGIRDAHRFRQLLQLEDVTLYLGAPVAVDRDTELRLRTAALGAARHAQPLVRISSESFNALTAQHLGARGDPSVVWTEPTARDHDQAAASKPVAVSGAAEQSESVSGTSRPHHS